MINGLIKLAEENNLGVAGYGIAGLGAMGASKNLITGKKTQYHGTSKENAEKIRREGLLASKGGTGASVAINSGEYVDASKGKIHSSRFQPVANMYANLAVKGESAFDNPMRAMFGKGSGEVIKMNMDYDNYKRMTIDNVGSDDISDIPKAVRPIAKNMAAKGSVNVTPAEISGSSATLRDRVTHTAKKMPSYVKNNPMRFTAGLGIASLGAGLGAKSITTYNKKRED